MDKKKVIAIHLLIFCLLSIIVVANFFSDGLPLWFYDHFWPILGEKYCLSSLFTWSNDGIGMSFVRALPNLLPMGLIIGINDYLGITLLHSQEMFYFFIIFGAACSMYLLTWVMELDQWGRFFAALLYAFGLSLIIDFLYLTLFAFLPLITGLYIYGIKKRKGIIYCLLMTLLWTLLATSAYSNPGYIILQWSLIGFFSIYYFFMDSKKQVFYFTSIMLITWLLINSFWIIPNFYSIQENLESSQIRGLSDINVMQGTSAQMRWALLGLPYGKNYLSTFEGDPVFAWGMHFVKNQLTIIMEIFFLLLSLSFLFFRDKKHQLPLYILIGLLFIVMIENGLNAPFHSSNVFIFSYLPLFTTIFRNLTKFNLLFHVLSALLIGFSIDAIMANINKRWKLRFITVVIILFIIYSFPLWKGYRFIEQGEFVRSSSIQIPEEYSQAEKFFNTDQRNNRILPFPLTKTYQYAFVWDHGYQGSSPYPYLFNKSTIGLTWGITNIIDTLADDVQNNASWQKTEYLLKLLDVNYLMYHQDTNWKYIAVRPQDWYRIDNQTYDNFFSEVAKSYNSTQLGKLQIISLNHPEQFLYLSHSLGFFNLTQGEFSSTQAPGFDEVAVQDIDEDYTNEIQYTMLDPTRYDLSITGEGTKYLILSVRFDRNWVLAEGSPSLWSRISRKDDDKQFKVNLYANGWLIEHPGTYTLYYYPQYVMYLSIMFSIVLLAILVAVCLMIEQRGKKR